VGSPPVQGGAPTGSTGPPDYQDTFAGPSALRVGHVVDFYSTSGQNMTFCYSVGTSRVGCSTSGTGWFHLLVRRGAMQYATLRLDGTVVARLVYRGVS
jgi:hypothetical protein